MIPSSLVLLVLALAAWRTWRFAALDTFPPLVWIRDRAVGVEWPDSTVPMFARPLLADFLLCPYCAGVWITLGWYLAWLAWPHGVLYGAVPLALNAGWAAAQSLLPD